MTSCGWRKEELEDAEKAILGEVQGGGEGTEGEKS